MREHSAVFTRLTRLAAALAAAMIVTLAATASVDAQYYPPGVFPPGYYPQRRYEVEPGYERPRYRERPRYYSEPEEYAPRRRGRFGSVCVTSRGECSAGGVVPIMSGCYCFIPGFGRKAGNVRY